METAGYIHSFQSMGAVDGPGLRFVVFLQGCPLRCVYCHNPDTWEFGKGEMMLPSRIVSKALRFVPYLKGKGVTLSGGEPLAQPAFTAELMRQFKKAGFHTALDTSCMGNPDEAEKILNNTDLALADVKFLSSEEYQNFCRGDFSRVTAFLNLTREKNIPLWIRRVVVPGLNDTRQHILDLLSFLEDFPNVEKVELLPFRKLCLEKYQRLSIPFPLADTPELPPERLKELEDLIPYPLAMGRS
ncbi:MAG: pyruvate formate-lyase-activating protein [Ruminococcus sp.]|jgi:pyruvate formate lyase activating enzyme